MFYSVDPVNDLSFTESISEPGGHMQCGRNGAFFSPDQFAQPEPELAALWKSNKLMVYLTFLGQWLSPSPEACLPSEIPAQLLNDGLLFFHASAPYHTHY